MDNVDEALESLITVLKECEEYNQYRDTKNEVKKDEALFLGMREYQKNRFRIHIDPKDTVGEEDRTLRLNYSKILENPAVDEHLKAERKYCKLIRRIEDRLSEAAGIDIGFLEE